MKRPTLVLGQHACQRGRRQNERLSNISAKQPQMCYDVPSPPRSDGLTQYDQEA